MLHPGTGPSLAGDRALMPFAYRRSWPREFNRAFCRANRWQVRQTPTAESVSVRYCPGMDALMLGPFHEGLRESL